MNDPQRVKELLRYFFPNGRREGNYWCVGDVTGVPGRSFKICLSGDKAGLHGDFNGSGNHSRNLLNLWMEVRQVDFPTALREAAEWTGYKLHSANGKKPFPSKPKSTAAFRTLDEAVAWAERKLKMCATRRDWYQDRSGNQHFVVVRFDGAEEGLPAFSPERIGLAGVRSARKAAVVPTAGITRKSKRPHFRR